MENKKRKKKPEGEEIEVTHTEWPPISPLLRKEEQKGGGGDCGGEEVRGLEETDEELRGLRTGRGVNHKREAVGETCRGPEAAPASPVERAATRNQQAEKASEQLRAD